LILFFFCISAAAYHFILAWFIAPNVFQEGISGMIIAYIVAAVIVVGFVGLRIYQYCFRFSKDARDYKRYRGFDHTTGKPRFDD